MADVHDDSRTLTNDIVNAVASLSRPGSENWENKGWHEVIVLVSRRVKPDFREAFEESLVKLREYLNNREGFIEMRAYEPPIAHDEHKVLIHFASPEALSSWQKTQECQSWIDSVKPFEDGHLELKF